ncbi:MAG TPA: hypothetical protein DDW74_03795 [Porphyromonadaceae bacterium]|jgi:hypothetical protein|nr:hypothetical protein [Porphyromonadaceae bacterium]
MDKIYEIAKKFKEIGFETEFDRENFSKNLNFDFEYNAPKTNCVQNTFMDDSTISNLKTDELCPIGTKS